MSEQRDSAGFLYQIGDTLTHRGVPSGENGEAGFRLFVLERMYEEHTGGVLRRYCCRVIGVSEGKVDLHGKCQDFDEVELCPLPNATDSTIPGEFLPLAIDLGRAYLHALAEKERLVAQCDFDGAAALRERVEIFKRRLETAASELLRPA